MASKNTAAFGIYSGVEALQAAVDTLRAEGFRSEDVSVLYPENVGSKDLATVKATKAPEGAVTGAGSGAVIGEHSVGWSASVHWPFLAWALLSRQVRLWRRLPGSVRVVRWVELQELS